jgi:hypothetical protein
MPDGRYEQIFPRFQCSMSAVPGATPLVSLGKGWHRQVDPFQRERHESQLLRPLTDHKLGSAITKFDTTNSIPVFFTFHRPDDSPKAIRTPSSRSANPCIICDRKLVLNQLLLSSPSSIS